MIANGIPPELSIEEPPNERRKSCRYLSGEAARLCWRDQGMVLEAAVVIRDISLDGASILHDGPLPTMGELFLRLDRDSNVDWVRATLRGFGRSGEMTILRIAFDKSCPYPFFRVAVGEYRMISDGPEPPLQPVVSSATPSSRPRRLPLLPRTLRIKRRLSGRRSDAVVEPRTIARDAG